MASAVRSLFLILLSVIAALAGPAAASTIHDALAPFAISGYDAGLSSPMTCEGSDCFYDESEGFEIDPESGRRELLARRRRYLSYDMLKKNQVPCSRRGASYYNCHRRGKANPYRRGCSYITRCARDLR